MLLFKFVSISGVSAPPPLPLPGNTECDTCCDGHVQDNTRRKATPDLLELATMYNNMTSVVTRTQSGPPVTSSRPRSLQSLVPDQFRPWSTDTGRIQAKPRQLEPLFNAPMASNKHLIIAEQKGQGGLHLSCNYTGVNNKMALEPISSRGSTKDTDTD